MRLFFLFSQIPKLELKNTAPSRMEGIVKVVSLEIFRHCYEKGGIVRAVRVLESTVPFPACTQPRGEQISFVFLSLDCNCLKEKEEAGVKREEPKRKRYSKACGPQFLTTQT